jgi:hypothetical protein
MNKLALYCIFKKRRSTRCSCIKIGLSFRSDIYSDLSPSSVLFVRRVRGAVMSQRTPWSGPQKLKNNTGFGVIRIQVASKSARAPLAGSDRYRYQLAVCCTRCTGTGTIMIDSLHPLFIESWDFQQPRGRYFFWYLLKFRPPFTIQL